MIRRALFGLVTLAVLVCAASAQTLTFPPLSGRVVDDAGIIDGAARDSVGRKLAEFESRTGAEIVVATVPSLQGTDIETYAVALANNWRLGSDGKNNGAILLIAPNVGKVAIQASEGLRDRLSDEVLLRIIRQTLIPKLAADDIAGGVSGGIDDMIWVLNGPPQRSTLALATQMAQATTPSSPTGLNFPALTGRVVDEAGILDSATRAALTQVSSDLEAKSTDQLVIVTLTNLRGTSIEDYGYQLGRAWQIGQKDKNNGVLLIVAPNDRKVRIEVGYGLEATLTDAITSFIIQNAILPRFKAGDFPGGIKRGAEDIVSVLTGDEEYKQRAVRAAKPQVTANELISMMVFVLIAGFIFINVIFSFIQAVRDVLQQLGVVAPRKKGQKSWLDDWVVTSGSSGGGSSGSSWSSGSSGGGGFSGGGGSFGGGGSSGSW
jgi:uncharacterized protein